MRRASCSPSHTPRTFTRSPSPASVRSVLPRRAALLAMTARGGGEDVGGGAVVLLEADDFRAGEIAARSAGCCPLRRRASHRSTGRRRRRSRYCRSPCGKQAQPEILRDVGVLVFVDQQVFELGVVVGEHFRVLGEDADGVEQQVAEIDRVQGGEPGLVDLVELLAFAVGELAGFVLRQFLGPDGAVLPAVDQARRDSAASSVSGRCSRLRGSAG